MTEGVIIGIAVTVILGLIGIIYKALTVGQKETKQDLKDFAEKTDGRLDEVEKDVAVIEERTKK